MPNEVKTESTPAESPVKVCEKVWTTEQLREDFEVLGFSYGICVVRRKADGVRGSLDFNHSPRVYFNFIPG